MSEARSAAPEQARCVGLSPDEVVASRAAHGPNVLTPAVKQSWWQLYLEKFEDPIVRILCVAAAIALVVGVVDGKIAEALGILAAIFLATFVAFVNEFKAQKEFELLDRASDDDLVRVIRAGSPTQVPKRDVVVGDIVLVEKGDEPPADGRILEAVSLEADESAFTGEPEHVGKIATTQAPQDLGDSAVPRDLLLRGSQVTEGHGIMEVTEVGDRTKVGEIASVVREDAGVETPLNIQLGRLSDLIGVLSFVIAGLLFVALVGRGVLRGELVLAAGQWYFAGVLFLAVAIALIRVWLPVLYDGLGFLGVEAAPPAWLGIENDDDDEDDGQAVDQPKRGGRALGWLMTFGTSILVFGLGTGLGYVLQLVPASPSEWLPRHAAEEFLMYFMIALTLIVVAVPEGLAMAVTLSLAYSMRKLMADNNLVKRMHACETIGAATVILTDKTGTLTRNEMRVTGTEFPSLPKGVAAAGPDELLRNELLLVEAIACNTTGDLDRNADVEACAVGNRTECALLFWLDSMGVDYVPFRYAFEVIYQVPFDNRRKYMATLGVSPGPHGRILYAKGAPEVILSHSTQVLTTQGPEPIAAHREALEAALQDAERRGMRCLAFAFHDAPEKGSLEIDHMTTDLTWLGFVAISDPVRDEVPAAIQACREAGIDVKIVTGDNPRTAAEIGRQIGLCDGHDQAHCVLGSDYRALADSDARTALAPLKVLARTEPEDKLRLVRQLQNEGHVVAFTGDGFNDVAALHQAQVGLAMGIRGSDAAKRVADIVIKDDSFTSVATGVKWGRALYQNIQRFILFQLTINVAACGIALIGPFIGVKLPLTVTQMLWVNLIMDTFAALALATEPPHDEVMKLPPRSPSAFIITRDMAVNIFGVGFLFLFLLIGLLLYFNADGQMTAHELSMFFAIFVMLQFWNLFNARALGLTQSALRGLSGNRGFLLIATVILVGQVLMTQFGGDVFRTTPLSGHNWLEILLGTSVVLWVGELWRLAKRLRAT